jgi:hypothetical protein
MRTFSVASGCCLLVILLGCAGFGGPSFDENRYPANQPADADVAGVYHPTGATAAMIAKGGYPPKEIVIVLDPGGNARLQNIPDWWRDGFGNSHGGFDNWTGSWKVTQNGNGRWELLLVLENPGGFATSVYLVGLQAPYLIGLVVGDPDNQREMQFERVGPANAVGPKGGDAQAK